MGAAISNKKSILALVKETTEGTPVAPSGATQFTPMQEGFAFKPAFNTLQNNEMQASIGKSKSELGSEDPSATMSHYIKASGVEGVEPDWKLLLEACLGAKTVTATEHDTVSGSTTSLIKVDTGEGASKERGLAVLVKDPVNGFNIRNLLSISGDDLTLAQKLAVAPGTGVNLGKSVLYKPADDDHPTFTSWCYRGNGGAIEMIAGCRVSDMEINAPAGEYINGNFTIAGVKFHFNPIIVGAADTKLDFLDNATVRVATVAAKTYKDPHDLAAAIQTAMNALGSGNTFTCTYSNTTGKFTLTSSGTTFTLKWNTGANAANTIGDKIGFDVAADDASALTYTSDSAQSWAAAYSPDYDDVGANVAKYSEILFGDAGDIACFGAQSASFKVSNTITKIPDMCEESGFSGSIVTGREVTGSVLARLSKHDADKFRRYREGSKTQLTFNFGLKSGGQWVPGKCVNIFMPTATITELDNPDQDGLVNVSIGLTAFVEDGKGEFYINFL